MAMVACGYMVWWIHTWPVTYWGRTACLVVNNVGVCLNLIALVILILGLSIKDDADATDATIHSETDG